MRKICYLLPFLFISSSAFALDTPGVEISRYTNSFDARRYLSAIQSTDTATLKKSANLAQTSSTATIMNNNLATTQANGLKALTSAGKIATVAGFLGKTLTGSLIAYAVIEGGVQVIKYINSNSAGQAVYESSVSAENNNAAWGAGTLIWTFSSNAQVSGQQYLWSPAPFDIIDQAYLNIKARNPVYKWDQYSNCRVHSANAYAYVCDLTSQERPDHNYYDFLMLSKEASPAACGPGQIINGQTCVGGPGATTVQQVVADFSTLHQSLPQAHLEAKVTPQALADLINAENTKQAQDVRNRALPTVSPQDVIDAVPAADWPRVGDLTVPVAPGTEDAQPLPVKVGDINTNITNNTWNETTTNNETKIDLGPDPGITPPGALKPETPTGDSLFQPFLNLVPEFRSFVMTGPGGNCPTPSFSVKGTVYTIHQHCDLFEANRNLISNSMLFIFSIMSVIIIFTI